MGPCYFPLHPNFCLIPLRFRAEFLEWCSSGEIWPIGLVLFLASSFLSFPWLFHGGSVKGGQRGSKAYECRSRTPSKACPERTYASVGMSQKCRRKRQNSACRPPSTLLLLQLPCRSPLSEGFPCPLFLPCPPPPSTSLADAKEKSGKGGGRGAFEVGMKRDGVSSRKEKAAGGEGGEERREGGGAKMCHNLSCHQSGLGKRGKASSD